ncbi:lantibiotic dehydratase C-terminal domain-containing protein [Sphingobacterium sp. E70]|uniref:lantibiotic dehydratase C-terminal domain-containing protein n=1 Tax=Sphingobacterium sp. E70 TaxID=2853439 RepID=UPI00211C3B36|nr:lantibiotic dehydratase C-terminal domain-containing protein [Sphingobacterium sp. E70]
MRGNWLSVHLYSAVSLDLILLHIVRPFLADHFIPSADLFFFIRYWDEGSHIRLRMQVPAVRSPIYWMRSTNRSDRYHHWDAS